MNGARCCFGQLATSRRLAEATISGQAESLAFFLCACLLPVLNVSIAVSVCTDLDARETLLSAFLTRSTTFIRRLSITLLNFIITNLN